MSCDGMLVQNVETDRMDRSEQFAFLKIVDQETWHRGNSGGEQSLAARYKQVFGLDWGNSYEEFHDNRTRLFEQYQFSYSLEDARTVVRRYFLPDQLTDYVRCRMTSNQGFAALAVDYEPWSTSVTVQLFWLRPGGPNTLNLRGTIVGGSSMESGVEAPSAFAQHRVLLEGSESLIFRRDPKSEFRLAITGYSEEAAAGFGVAADVHIPPMASAQVKERFLHVLYGYRKRADDPVNTHVEERVRIGLGRSWEPELEGIYHPQVRVTVDQQGRFMGSVKSDHSGWRDSIVHDLTEVEVKGSWVFVRVAPALGDALLEWHRLAEGAAKHRDRISLLASDPDAWQQVRAFLT